MTQPSVFNFLDEADARRCALYWQKQLRLSDWAVEVLIVRRHALACGRVAECVYHLESKSAIIRLLDASDHDPASLWAERDQEVGLVHELLHLHVAPFDPQPKTLEQKFSEVMIESVAQALVLINRGHRR